MKKTHVHKIPRFRGGGILGLGGGGECRFYFYGRADFSDFGHILKATHIQKAPSPELW